MTEVVRLVLDNDTTVLVELPRSGELPFEGGVTPTGGIDELKKRTTGALEELPRYSADKLSTTLVKLSRKLIEAFVNEFGEERSIEVSLEYGVTLAAGMDLKLVSMSNDGAVKVTISWKSP